MLKSGLIKRKSKVLGKAKEEEPDTTALMEKAERNVGADGQPV